MARKVIPIVAAIGAESAPAPHFAGGALADPRDGPLRDLRISVPTDATSAACTACRARFSTPDYVVPAAQAILTFEEITRLARVFVGLGVRRSASPAASRWCARSVELISMLAAASRPHADHQRSLLASRRAALKTAGLNRVTVSLDSLDEATFRAMNDADFPVAKVLEAIDVAAAAGFAPMKVNMVVKRG